MPLPYEKLPLWLQGGVKRYFEQRIRPGHFLTAVLANDLYAALGRADDQALKDLPDLVKWLYWEAPSEAYGSKEKLAKWLGQPVMSLVLDKA